VLRFSQVTLSINWQDKKHTYGTYILDVCYPREKHINLHISPTADLFTSFLLQLPLLLQGLWGVKNHWILQRVIFYEDLAANSGVHIAAKCACAPKLAGPESHTDRQIHIVRHIATLGAH